MQHLYIFDFLGELGQILMENTEFLKHLIFLFYLFLALYFEIMTFTLKFLLKQWHLYISL